MTCLFRGIVTPEVAEAIAAKKAIFMAKNLLISQFILEGDALGIIQNVPSSEDAAEPLINDIRIGYQIIALLM